MKIDIESLAAKLGFENEEVAMLLEMFLETAHASMQALKSAIEAEDCNAIREHAHSIKGSAANLTLEPLYLAAKALEEAAKAQQAIDYMQHYAQLETLIGEISVPEVI